MLKNVYSRFMSNPININITSNFDLHRRLFIIQSLKNFCKKAEANKKNYDNANFFEELSKLGISTTPDKEKSKFSQASNFKLKNISKEEKEKRAEILKREFINNPEFLKAFPHLEDVIRMQLKIPNNLKIEEYIKKEIRISEQDKPYFEKQTNYFESLLNKHTGYDLKTEEEKIKEQTDIFLDGVQDPKGPLKLMSRVEKEKIHEEIDIRMQELEDSGLSKEEILYNKSEGVPLKYDKFFQYLKENRIARELLVKPNEKFSSDIVIEKALKQNIGPDASMGLDKRKIELEENLSRTRPMEEHNRMFDKKQKTHLLKEDDFDYRENYEKKLKLFENFHKERPATFVNPPLMRSHLRQKYMIRTIRKRDVTWKNLPFLVKFLNEAGKLMNKYQTRLPTNVHRKLARSVKHARHLGLLPYVDYLRGYDKIPLTSTYNDFVDDISTVIDKKSGMIKHINQPSLQDKFTYSNFQSSTEALKAQNERILAEKFKNTLKVDRNEIPFVPDFDQRELLRAQNYNIKQKLNKKSDKEIDLNINEKIAYEKVTETIKDNFNGSNLIDFYLNEKSYNYGNIKQTQKYFIDIEKDKEITQTKNSNLNLTKLKEETKKKIEDFIQNHNLYYEEKSHTEQPIIKQGKTFLKKEIHNIEPKLIIKDSKRNNFRRYKSEN